MRFLGGFLKTLSIIFIIGATIACTAVAVTAEVLEAYLVMSLIWVGTLVVALNVWGTGAALSHVVKLKKKVEALELRMNVLATQRAAAPEAVQPQPVQPVNAPVEPVAPVVQPEVNQAAAPVQKKKSKVWIPIVAIAGVLVLGTVGLFVIKPLFSGDQGGVQEEAAETAPAIWGEAEVETPEDVPCGMTIDAVCVDDSYEDDEGSSLKMVYLFYSLEATDSNLKIDSKYTKMIINGNGYESDHFADKATACKYAPNYYYGSYIRDVYVGETKQVIATFKIPAAELEGGKEVTLEDTQIPGIGSIVLNTDEFEHFESGKKIAKAVDPDGYAAEKYAREKADSDIASAVKKKLNGYYWTFYVNSTSYKLEFWKKNNFSVTTAFGSNEGTYSVRNGYIFCKYPDTGYTVEIPYTYDAESDEFDLDTIGGFDVFE